MKRNTNKQEAGNFFNALTVNLSTAEIPEINPAKLKKSRDEWVAWGQKNDYPDMLITTAKKATIHQSFIQKKQQGIKAEGFSYSDDIKAFVEAINEYGESADDILEAISVDLSILETFALAVRYNKLKTKIVAVDYIDSSKVRCDKNLDQYGRVQGYWLSADWSNTRENVPQYFETFDPSNIKSTTQLYYFRRRALGQPFYPEVSYGAALNHVDSAHKLSIFLTNTINNGFYSSAIVEINSDATPEQQRAFVQNFQAKNTGSENAGKVTFIWTPQANSVKINPVNPSDITPMLNAARHITNEEIVSAHGGNGILVGVQQGGNGLGSDGNLYNVAMIAFYENVIREFQRPILSFFGRVLDFNGYTEYELEIKSNALLMDTQMKQDLLKPEAYITDYGYDVEDLIGYEEEGEENKETTNGDGDGDRTDADDTSEDPTPVL